MASFKGYITSGMFLMIVVIGFSLFVGGTYDAYPNANVNDSFNSTYNQMADIYTQSNQLQSNVIKNSTEEGDVRTDFNILDAFGILKDAFLKLPAILINTLRILVGQPTSTQSGGILYIFATTIGVPLEILDILIAIITMSLVFLVFKAILGSRDG